MTLATGVRRFLVSATALTVIAIANPAWAQEITDSHLKAARAAVASIHATDVYDSILPAAAAALKQSLIGKNPDLQELITSSVDNAAVALAGRRADLEKEAAMAYAKVMTEAELNEIATFYGTEAGKKLLSDGPIVVREVDKAADIWQRGIARDLSEEVAKVLAAQAPKPAAPAAPAEGAAPAPAEGAAPAAPAN